MVQVFHRAMLNIHVSTVAQTGQTKHWVKIFLGFSNIYHPLYWLHHAKEQRVRQGGCNQPAGMCRGMCLWVCR